MNKISTDNFEFLDLSKYGFTFKYGEFHHINGSLIYDGFELDPENPPHGGRYVWTLRYNDGSGLRDKPDMILNLLKQKYRKSQLDKL